MNLQKKEVMAKVDELPSLVIHSFSKQIKKIVFKLNC